MVSAAIKTAGATKDYFQDKKENYFRGSQGQWQGKMSKERFPDEKFTYDEFVKLTEENDRFGTIDLKFSLSSQVSAGLSAHPQAKEIVIEAVSRVAEQIQEDMKIRFKKDKYAKEHFHIRVSTNSQGEWVARVVSHNVANKNISHIASLLDDRKYRDMFGENMVKELKGIGVKSEKIDFDLKYFVKEGRVALDLVCHAPKSVSLAMMFPEHYEKIIRCHEKANEAAIRFVEENYITTRVQIDGIGQRILTHNIISARFIDFYNRQLQPQLHTHNLIFNTTRNPYYDRAKKFSKEFLTIDFKTILDNFKVIDGVYKAELINLLRKEGYRLSHDKDNQLNFEIKGFSREQLLHFSRTEIDDKLKEMGTDRETASAKVRQLANLMTRPDKVHMEFEQWAEGVRREMETMTIDAPEMAQVKEVPVAEKMSALVSAVDGFLYEQAAFTRQEFINGILARAGDILSAENVEDYFDHSGRLINLGEMNGKTYFSTRENIELENCIYQYMAEAKNRRPGLIEDAIVERHLHQSDLNASQKEALRFMARCPDRVAAVLGAPGSGKSYLLQRVKTLFEHEGYRVYGLAPSNKAVLNLREKSGLPALTLHSFFIKLQVEAGTWEKEQNPLDLRLTDFSGLKPGTKKELWVVDECSLIDNQAMNRLLQAAGLRNAYVVLVGDTRQLQPVGAGRPFTNLVKDGRLQYAEIKEILRQKEVWKVFDPGNLSKTVRRAIESTARRADAVVSFVKGPPLLPPDRGQIGKLRLDNRVEVSFYRDTSVKDAVKNIINDNILGSLRDLQSRIVEIKDNEARFEEIARHFCTLSPGEQRQTSIITGTNRDRDRINETVRCRLMAQGDLAFGSSFIVTNSRGIESKKEFSVGDRIIFLKKTQTKNHKIMKDDIGRILKIETGFRSRSILPWAEREPVTLFHIDIQGQKIALDIGKDNHIDHAYCLTTYKQQAASHKRVIANFDTRQYNINSKNDFLVKLSRAEGEVVIFTDDHKSLYDAVKKEQSKVSVRDFAAEQFSPHKKVDIPAREEWLSKIAETVEYRNAAFSRAEYIAGSEDIYREMVELGLKDIEITGNDLEKLFDDRAGSGNFVELGPLKGVSYFSTPENIAVEMGIYDRVEGGRKKRTGIDEWTVDAFLEKTSLSGGQKEAVRFMAVSADRVIAIQGAPGSGKSFMLDHARNLFESEGYKAVALAPSQKVVQKLKEKSRFDQAASIHSFLIALQQEAGTWDPGKDPLDLRQTNLKGLTPGSHKEVWFVPEASLIDNLAMNRLLDAAERKNVYVILIGDTRQLQPVGAGRPFYNLVKDGKISYLELKEIVRPFRDVSLREAVDKIINDQILESVQAMLPHTREIRDNEERFREMARCYTGLTPGQRGQAVMVTGTNRDRIKLNENARDILKEKGELGPGYLFDVADSRGVASRKEFSVGDRVLFLKKVEIAGQTIMKDDTGLITQIDTGQENNTDPDNPGKVPAIHISTNGREIVLNMADYNYLDHVYCLTAYRVQAGTYNQVIANFDTKQQNVISRNDWLAKLSCAGGEVLIFTNDKKGLYDGINKEQRKISIADFPPDRFKAYIKPEADPVQELLTKIARIFEYRNAAFTRKDFVHGSRTIFMDMIEQGVKAENLADKDFAAYFDSLVKQEYFFSIGQVSNETWYSSQENITVEMGIYEKVQRAKDKRQGFDEAKASDYLKTTTLNKEQRQAVTFMSTAQDRVIAIQGAPGVGKSFMLDTARNLFEEEGYKVVALAPSNKATLNLKERAYFENAATIHAYLIGLQKENGTWKEGQDPLDLRQADLDGLKPGSHKEAWFVDEASLIDNHAMNRLLQAAELKDAAVVLIGDKNQLQPVGAGKAFTILLDEKRIAFREVKEILRQKAEWRIYGAEKLAPQDKRALVRRARSGPNNAALVYLKGEAPPVDKKDLEAGTYRMEKYTAPSGAKVMIVKDHSLKEAVKDAVDRDIAASLGKLQARITQVPEKKDRLMAIAEKYAGLPARERNDTVIITATNSDRLAINTRAREILQAKGELKPGFDFTVTDILGKKQVREFSAGDKVIFLKKSVIDDVLISKDDVGMIKKIENRSITIQVNQKEVAIPIDRYNHIDHAYARTTYRVQGADYNRVLCNIDTRQKRVNSLNDFLVKISRSRHILDIYTDSREHLHGAVKNEQFKSSINQFFSAKGPHNPSSIVPDGPGKGAPPLSTGDDFTPFDDSGPVKPGKLKEIGVMEDSALIDPLFAIDLPEISPFANTFDANPGKTPDAEILPDDTGRGIELDI